MGLRWPPRPGKRTRSWLPTGVCLYVDSGLWSRLAFGLNECPSPRSAVWVEGAESTDSALPHGYTLTCRVRMCCVCACVVRPLDCGVAAVLLLFFNLTMNIETHTYV